MRNNSMKKYILEFLAAALLVMAIIGASKYQQKEAIADSSASDGKSAATTESTDSKTALTTSGTEETKTESQSTEPSTETQGSTNSETPTVTPAANTSNTTSSETNAGTTIASGSQSEMKTEAKTSNNTENEENMSKQANMDTNNVKSIANVTIKSVKDQNNISVTDATVTCEVKVGSDKKDDVSIKNSGSIEIDISGLNAAKYTLYVTPKTVTTSTGKYTVTSPVNATEKEFEITVDASNTKSVKTVATIGYDAITFQNTATFSYEVKEVEKSEPYTISPSVLDYKGKLDDNRSKANITYTIKANGVTYSEDKGTAEVSWDYNYKSDPNGNGLPYYWEGTIKEPYKLSNGTIVTATNPNSKRATIDVYAMDTSVPGKLTWTVYIESFALNESDTDSRSKIKSITYQLYYEDEKKGASRTDSIKTRTEDGEKLYYFTNSIASTPLSTNYELEIQGLTLSDGSVLTFDEDEVVTSNITYVKSGNKVNMEMIDSVSLEGEYYLPSVYAVKCAKSDGFSTTTEDDHTSLAGGKITTSTLNSASTVGKILDYAYKKNKYIQAVIDDYIESSSDDLELSLIFVAKEKSSADKESELKDKARDFGSDSKDADLKKYFDLSLYMTLGGDDEPIYDDSDGHSLSISEAGTNIEFTYTIPSDVKLSSNSSSVKSRYFNIVRYHNGAHSAGIDEYKKNVSTLNPKTSEFSEFALAYYDKSSSSSSSSSSRSSSYYGSSSMSGSASIADTIDKTNAPKTGDNFNSRKWIYFLVIGIVVALCSFILYQDTREFNEDRKQPKA